MNKEPSPEFEYKDKQDNRANDSTENREDFKNGYFKLEGYFNQAKFTMVLPGHDLETARQAAINYMKKQKENALSSYGNIPTIKNASVSGKVIFVEVTLSDESEDGFRPAAKLETERYLCSVAL